MEKIFKEEVNLNLDFGAAVLAARERHTRHSSITITGNNTYGNVVEGVTRSASDKLEETIFGCVDSVEAEGYLGHV